MQDCRRAFSSLCSSNHLASQTRAMPLPPPRSCRTRTALAVLVLAAVLLVAAQAPPPPVYYHGDRWVADEDYGVASCAAGECAVARRELGGGGRLQCAAEGPNAVLLRQRILLQLPA